MSYFYTPIKVPDKWKFDSTQSYSKEELEELGLYYHDTTERIKERMKKLNISVDENVPDGELWLVPTRYYKKYKKLTLYTIALRKVNRFQLKKTFNQKLDNDHHFSFGIIIDTNKNKYFIL